MFDTLEQLMEEKGLNSKRSVAWKKISEEERLSEKFLADNARNIHWQLVSRHQPLSEEFIRQYSGFLYWDEIIRHQHLSELFLEEFSDAEKWQPQESQLSAKQLKALEVHGKPFDEREYWALVSAKRLSPMFIEKHQDRLDWQVLSEQQHLPMSLIGRHADKVDWLAVTRSQKLTERFIEKHKGQVEWETLSFHQELSERFINRHSDKMAAISAEQPRSEAFLYMHLDKMDPDTIVACQEIGEAAEFESFKVFSISRNSRKKYIVEFHHYDEPDSPRFLKLDDEGFYDLLEEYDLLDQIEADFPELQFIEEMRF
ncbi:hypothetical protein BBI15_13330 [Planococcus plakortidis]|uniref:Uncharacterized protein n=1 Tax=Planococcus plakortidis TaxID=1038856 RepID=A0A1C7EBJ0_9BACL|nr:hypothetical protein [Planococcus plakortidis]ANU21098.1 hypothetical protein BBI15_13330 [Planococcus plakortidis]